MLATQNDLKEHTENGKENKKCFIDISLGAVRYRKYEANHEAVRGGYSSPIGEWKRLTNRRDKRQFEKLF